jgi:hypothetical protein
MWYAQTQTQAVRILRLCCQVSARMIVMMMIIVIIIIVIIMILSFTTFMNSVVPLFDVISLFFLRSANLILNLFSLMVDANVPDIALEPDKTVKKVSRLPK